MEFRPLGHRSADRNGFIYIKMAFFHLSVWLIDQGGWKLRCRLGFHSWQFAAEAEIVEQKLQFLQIWIFLKLEIFNPILKFADLTASFSHFGVLAKAMQCTPAQTVPVWLWCPTSSASVRLSLCHSPPIGTKSIA